MVETARVRNLSRGIVLGERVALARTYLSRLVGLLNRSSLSREEGLWLEPCNSVHMWFMRFPIDVIFLSREGQVVSLVPNLPIWSFTWPQTGAHVALELPVGVIAQSGTSRGDQIVLEAACA